MAKRFLEDMVKIKRQRLETRKDSKPIQPPQLIQKEREKEAEMIAAEVDYNIGANTYNKKVKPRYLLWVVALISMAFCFFAVSFLFSKAEIIVNPKKQDAVLNENLSADKDSEVNGLSYDLVIIPGSVSKNIQASGEKNVSTKASGAVIIFNAFSFAKDFVLVSALVGIAIKICEASTS